MDILLARVNNHAQIGTMLEECDGSVLLKPALTRMLQLVIAAERVLKDREHFVKHFQWTNYAVIVIFNYGWTCGRQNDFY